MSLTKVDSLSWLKHLLEVVTFWTIDLFNKSGISDHEIICVESALEALVLGSNPRKVYLWHRADFELKYRAIATTLHLTTV